MAEKYKHLDFEDFIRKTLTESGYDEKMMDNVYINENVDRPSVFGCYKNDDGKIIAYFTNERSMKITREYDDPVDFMKMFISTASLCSKYPLDIINKQTDSEKKYNASEINCGHSLDTYENYVSFNEKNTVLTVF